MVHRYRTFSNHPELVQPCTPVFPCNNVVREGSVQDSGGAQGSKVFVQANTVCSGHSHEFCVVRRYGTFSTNLCALRTRCVGYVYSSAEWFDCIEPPQKWCAAVEPLGVPLAKMVVEKVQHSRTTQNSCE